MTEDRSGAFARWAAERRAVRGPRGDVVTLFRYHAPMAGRAYDGALPPLRNRWDVRHWANKARPGRADFVSAAERLWREFCAALDQGEALEALALRDLDAPARREAARRAVVMAWAEAFGDRPVTAAALRDVWPVREAIGAVARPGLDPDDAVTGAVVSRYVRDIAAAGLVCGGWRITAAGLDRHSKAARFRLSAGQAPAAEQLPA